MTDTDRTPTGGAHSGGNGASRDARALSAVEKRARVVEMRIEGRSFEEIATTVGYAHRSAARKAFRTAMAERKAELDEIVRATRALIVSRTDLLIQAQWPKAIGGSVKAARLVMEAHRDLRKMFGIDVPIDHRIRLTSEVEALLDRAKEKLPPATYELFLAVMAGEDITTAAAEHDLDGGAEHDTPTSETEED